MKSCTRVFALLAVVALTACGGRGEAPVGGGFGQPLRSMAASLCDKGSNDTDAVRYVSIDGVCTPMFAPMLDVTAAAQVTAGGPLQPATADVSLGAAHTPFTWTTFLSWAVARYPQYFSGGTQDGVYEGYTYRYWPSTGHYLALRDSNKLYVMGPATDGDILYIGTLDALSCLIYPANCAATGTGTTGTGTTGSTGSTGTTGSADIAGSVATSAAITSTSPYTSTIESTSDEDWFAINLTAGTSYTFNLEGASTSKGTLADPYLRLYDSTGRMVTDSDDVSYPSNLNSRLTYTPATSARFYVSAGAFSSLGTYQLTASAESSIGSTGSTGTPSYQSAYDQCFIGTPALYTSTYCGAYASAISTGSSATAANLAGAAAAGSNVGNVGTGQSISSTGTPSSSTGTGSTANTFRLTTGTTGAGQGAVSPPSGTFARGTVGIIYAQPQFFSEFMGWTSRSTSCVSALLGCEINLQSDQFMEARLEPAVFQSSFDANYTTRLTESNGSCVWQVTWSGTKSELRFVLSGGVYVGRLRLTGLRRAVATSAVGITCNSSTTNLDSTFTVDGYSDGAGYSARVLVFDGRGDEYLTLSTGLHLPGPNISGVAGFVPVSMTLTYTGTNRSGSSGSFFNVLTRYGR